MKIYQWFRRLTLWPRLFLGTLTISIPFYFAAFLGSSVTAAYEADTKFSLLIHAVVFTVLITLVTFFYRLLFFYYHQYEEAAKQEHAALFQAFALCDRTVVAQHKVIKEAFRDGAKNLRTLIASMERIQEIINDTYATFESMYGSQERPEERLDFEVTFMTKSYKDGYITIPCAANRSGRKPRSMILREKDPNIYRNTETARLYSADRPDPIIIEDTSKPSYAEVYPAQKERIRSSIIYPVLSENNVLLGTLVVHCDKTGFFQLHKKKFWSDLLEVFAKRIAVEKTKIDQLWDFTKKGPVSVTLDYVDEF